ncbi:MAG: hypothetical protein IJT75_00520 [Bacteroidaceae bacterium]|nr:hypothetical protein [Bacteroidaceae bacterium]
MTRQPGHLNGSNNKNYHGSAENWRTGSTCVGFSESDLTANTHGTSRQDQNGETAALIRIVTTEKGFSFEGGSLGIVGTVQKTGELWLYVPRYAQKLTIKHPTFGVLRDYAYPQTIEGGRTYELLLDIGTGRYVTINTSRAASDLELDGQYIGNTAMTVSPAISPRAARSTATVPRHIASRWDCPCSYLRPRWTQDSQERFRENSPVKGRLYHRWQESGQIAWKYNFFSRC